MDTFIQKFHSGWAYLAIALLVFAVVNSIIGKTSGKEFTAKDRNIALFALIGVQYYCYSFDYNWLVKTQEGN